MNLYPWTTLGGGLSTLKINQDVIPLKFKSESVLIMSLIVLVPFIAGMNTVEIARFTRSILVFPVIARCTSDILLKVE